MATTNEQNAWNRLVTDGDTAGMEEAIGDAHTEALVINEIVTMGAWYRSNVHSVFGIGYRVGAYAFDVVKRFYGDTPRAQDVMTYALSLVKRDVVSMSTGREASDHMAWCPRPLTCNH